MPHHRNVAQSLSRSQRSALLDTWAAVRPIREVPIGVSGLSAWRGKSATRYLVSTYSLASAEPADLLNAVVLFVARATDGVATIVHRERSVTEAFAETLLETADLIGASEVHCYRLHAHSAEPFAVITDLSGFAVEVW